jgi:hypothetical protein
MHRKGDTLQPSFVYRFGAIAARPLAPLFSLEAPHYPRLSSLVGLTEWSLLQTLVYGPDVMQNIQRGPSSPLEAWLVVYCLIGREERCLVYCGLTQRQRGDLLLLS